MKLVNKKKILKPLPHPCSNLVGEQPLFPQVAFISIIGRSNLCYTSSMFGEVKAQSWSSCDADIKNYVDLVIDSIKQTLNANLVGVYLHGSLALGSYYKPKSDLDLIVVVNDKLTPDSREKFAQLCTQLSEKRPTLGNLELSVITKDVAKNFVHPCPFEVHYSTDWHTKIKSGEVDFSKDNTDPDLSSHLTYVVKRGVVLFGQPISEVFGEVPWKYFIDSILDDFNWIIDGEHILETPYYSILNICRVIRTLAEVNQQVYSKDEGAEWALNNLPKLYLALIRQAVDVYRSSVNMSEDQRRQGLIGWDEKQLLEFRDYAKNQVNQLLVHLIPR